MTLSAAQIPVVIAGAGPVGLSCALQLVRAGVPVVVLEREAELPTDMRASTFHPSTLDLLHESGLAARLVACGTPVPRWQFMRHRGERIVFDLGQIADLTRHPFRLQCEQFRLTRLIAGELRENPLFELRLGAPVTGVSQDGDAVRVDFGDADAAGRLTAAWLIAADGGRSTLRGLLGLAFEGSEFSRTSITLVLDHPFHRDHPELLGVNYVWTDQGHYSLMRVREQWRFTYSPRPGQSVDEALADDQAQASLQAVYPSAKPYRIRQRNHYTLHQRCLDRFRVGRILFAGDAAHLNSPAGGMGMNSGIHDAYCLAAHLLPVLAGADPALLDRYDRRRRTIAREEVQRLSARNYRRHRETDPRRRGEIWRELQRTAQDPARLRDYLLDASLLRSLERERQID